jgi:hypothetical protein
MKASIYIIKELVQPKMIVNSRKFLTWKERWREIERGRERFAKLWACMGVCVHAVEEGIVRKKEK